MTDLEENLMRQSLIGLDGYRESLEDSFGMRLPIKGSEYIFEPDVNLPLSPKEAVLISLLASKCLSHPATMDANWIDAFMQHNNLWRHFKKIER